MFERAIELDSAYGPAYAGLATVHATLYEWFGARDEDLSKAERISQRALELAPISPRRTWREAARCRGDTTRRRANSETARAREWSQRSLELYPDDLSTLVAPPACTPGQATRKRRSTSRAGVCTRLREVRLDRARRDYDNLRDDPRFARLVAKLK